MAQTRTALGTNSSKASGTSLSINDVTVPVGASLVVGIAYEDSQGQPSTIKYGEKVLSRAVKQIHSTAGFEVGLWFARNIRKETSRDIVATWGAAIEARAMFASYLTEAGAEDVQSKDENFAATTITTGANEATTAANTFHIAALASKGPNTDTVGSAISGDTLGQTIGTSGGVDTTNVFLRETYEVLTILGNLRGRVENATSRDNAGAGVAFKAYQTFTIDFCDQHHRDMNEQPDWVVLRVSDEGTGAFEMHIDPVDFDAMSDAEVETRVKEWCAAYAERSIDDASNVDEDSARSTRMATFVNDEIVL